MRKFAEYASVCLLMLATVACKKEERELMYTNQETKIETFVNKCLATAAPCGWNTTAARSALCSPKGATWT